MTCYTRAIPQIGNNDVAMPFVPSFPRTSAYRLGSSQYNVGSYGALTEAGARNYGSNGYESGNLDGMAGYSATKTSGSQDSYQQDKTYQASKPYHSSRQYASQPPLEDNVIKAIKAPAANGNIEDRLSETSTAGLVPAVVVVYVPIPEDDRSIRTRERYHALVQIIYPVPAYAPPKELDAIYRKQNDLQRKLNEVRKCDTKTLSPKQKH